MTRHLFSQLAILTNFMTN